MIITGLNGATAPSGNASSNPGALDRTNANRREHVGSDHPKIRTASDRFNTHRACLLIRGAVRTERLWLGQGATTGSVGTPLKLPRCFEGILDRIRVASSEVSYNHHVLDIPGRDAEGSGELPQYRIAEVEIGPDHQVHMVQLTRDEPAVIPPLGQPVPGSAAHSRQGLGQASDVIQVHYAASLLPPITITGVSIAGWRLNCEPPNQALGTS
jgi:hypothetical protein